MNVLTSQVKFRVKTEFSFIDSSIDLYPVSDTISSCIEEVLDYIEVFICDLEDLRSISIEPSRR